MGTLLFCPPSRLSEFCQLVQVNTWLLPSGRVLQYQRPWSDHYRVAPIGNISDVLNEKGQAEAAPLFWSMRDARDYSSVKACSDALESCLKRHNVSALNSYLEAKEDLLAIHRLHIGAELRAFFSTTNPIESLNSLLEEDLRRVKRWRDSQHFQRWMATACLRNEKRMHRIKGHRALPALVIRLQELCNTKLTVDNKAAVP